MTDSLYLGIDIGTSKVAIVVRSHEGNMIEVFSEAHNAIVDTGYSTRCEQNPKIILEVCHNLIKAIPINIKQKISAIGITGQMHGILIVNSNYSPVTNLVNWQDRRCSESPGFLSSISQKTKYKLSDGFGFATLCWFIHKQGLPENACFATTVQDLLVKELIGAKELSIDTSMAASWGFFNEKTQSWDYEAIKLSGIELKMLPKVFPCGNAAGKLSPEVSKETGLPLNTLVMLPIGDNQASLMGTIKDIKTDIAITLGTSGQISFISDFPITTSDKSKYDNRPYAFGKVVVVAAALCGGNAWEWLAKFIAKTVETVGLKAPPIEKIYEIMDDEGMHTKEEVMVRPNFYGERYDEELKGSIEGITLENLNIGTLSRGLARGLVRNMKDMLPEDILKSRKRVIGSGNALRRIKLFRVMVEEELGLPLEILGSKEETAIGAVINAYNKLNNICI